MCFLHHSTLSHPQMTPAHFLLHSTWPVFVQSYATINTACFLTSACFNYLWMSRMSARATSFLSKPNPFLVLCNIFHYCPSALVNILHTQHLWSVFYCSSSGETSVAALQMDTGTSPETMLYEHLISHMRLKTPDLDHLRLERKLPEHKAELLSTP